MEAVVAIDIEGWRQRRWSIAIAMEAAEMEAVEMDAAAMRRC